MKYAIIENGIVVNVIVADQNFIDEHYPNAVLIKDTDFAGPGFSYDGEVFVEPEGFKGIDIIDVEEVTPTPALEG